MGTRSITIVKNKDKENIVEIYREYDGYVKEHGKKLIDFINSGKLVNKIPSDDKKYFNGIECFTAQLIGYLKQGEAGNIYLYPPTDNFQNKKDYWDKYGVEYYYEIDYKLNVRCWDCMSGKEINLKEIK